MKATIIVSIALCLVIGGIAGWALRGLATHGRGSVSMVDITPEPQRSLSSGNSLIAVYDSGTLTIAEYNPSYNGGAIEHIAKSNIK